MDSWIVNHDSWLVCLTKDRLKKKLLNKPNSLITKISIILFVICLTTFASVIATSYLLAVIEHKKFFISISDAIFLLIAYVIFSAVLSSAIASKVHRYLTHFRELIRTFYADDIIIPKKQDFEVDELGELETFLIQSLNTKLEKTKMDLEFSQTAIQVAHDIRSPLAALNTVLKNVLMLPEPQRLLIRNATRRINDITNNMLRQYRVKNRKAESMNTQEEAALISSLLDEIISEKRIQFSDRHIGIELEIDNAVYATFVRLDPICFKRIISNLVNNAVEAISNKGWIHVKMHLHQSFVVIKIIDDGKGISAELLPKIKQGGVSLGKKDGSGIGIASAIKYIKEWGGDYDIESEKGKGTCFIIYLPSTKEPVWFQHDINLSKDMTVVILDDDASIHNIWTSRFQGFLKSDVIKIEHFYEEFNFVEYCKKHSKFNHLFLVDYELIGHKSSGLNLIKKLDLAGNSILVTSRYEERTVRQDVLNCGIRIIPKNMAPYIPIVLHEKRIDLVLIDDSKELADAWKLMAKLKNKRILTFNSSGAFKDAIDSINKDALIYIDFDLKEDRSGDVIAKEIYEQGFRDIYLATGYDVFGVPKSPWIKSVVGKDFPVE